MRKSHKISVIGAGFVGSAVTFALMESGIASELVLVDSQRAKAEGEALDIVQGAAFVKSTDVIAGDYADIQDSNLVVITAGANQKEGETRLDLCRKNVQIFCDIVPKVIRYAPQAILLVVANPVDVLTYAAWRLSGLPASQVIGSGTVLDSSRLRYALARRFDMDAKSIHAHVAGEHGDSEFSLWSSAFVGSMSLENYCQKEKVDYHSLQEEVSREVRDAAYQIIQKKGYTNYAIALAVRRIAEAILRDERSVLSISSYDPAQGIYYSMPSVVGLHGRMETLMPELNEKEAALLAHSVAVLKDSVAIADEIIQQV